MEIQKGLAKASVKSNLGAEPCGDNKNWLKEPVKAMMKPALHVNPEEGISVGVVSNAMERSVGVMTPDCMVWY
ncbi:hypothetical protein HC752_07120 [Vibrio sp. S9_S30]|uniref:hypothetical protein n=1 Tax=Vibrio sp. S9_S30 TaxID=2720226 RepID=UPI001680C448|nr:hypothetical protein [Vibrio sp. S9_S30]MBD1556702.1 hypothetical protein [Vibrio sp. S9_S30]